jgi:hypothetical protein
MSACGPTALEVGADYPDADFAVVQMKHPSGAPYWVLPAALTLASTFFQVSVSALTKAAN